MAKGAPEAHDGAWTQERTHSKKGAAFAALLSVSVYCRLVVFFRVLPKLVSTEAPMVPSICLAASAYWPCGCSSRYLLKASAVPGGAVILPVLSVVALPSRLTPFQ